MSSKKYWSPGSDVAIQSVERSESHRCGFPLRIEKALDVGANHSGLVLDPPDPESSLLRHFSDQASLFHPCEVPLNSRATCAC